MKEEGAASGGSVGIPNDSRKPLLPYPLALAAGLPFLFNFVLLVSFVRSFVRVLAVEERPPRACEFSGAIRRRGMWSLRGQV